MKNKKYTHIAKAERLEIAILLDKGYSFRTIAKVLRRSVSSISEEISENLTNGKYDPEKGHHNAYRKRKYSKYQGMKVVQNIDLRNYIEEKINDDWSPEAIEGRIKNIDTHIRQISAKGIYKFLYTPYGRNLEKRLFYHGFKKKHKTASKLERLKDRVFIDQRPKIIDKRKRFGDWEGDFIVSGKNGKGVIFSLYERKSKYCILKKFLAQNMQAIYQYIFEITGEMIMNSLTLDNDIMFKKHKELSKLLGKPIYFCHPYHSWEKGGVENINKLVRKYIPKGDDISQYSDEYLLMIQNKLNNRPRECLKYKTPYEVMREKNQFKDKDKYLLSDILKVEETKKAECSA